MVECSQEKQFIFKKKKVIKLYVWAKEKYTKIHFNLKSVLGQKQ